MLHNRAWFLKQGSGIKCEEVLNVNYHDKKWDVPFLTKICASTFRYVRSFLSELWTALRSFDYPDQPHVWIMKNYEIWLESGSNAPGEDSTIHPLRQPKMAPCCQRYSLDLLSLMTTCGLRGIQTGWKHLIPWHLPCPLPWLSWGREVPVKRTDAAADHGHY